MVHRFYTTPDTAHQLTKLKKRHGFYFRTLTRTDNIGQVYCEVTDPGHQFIIDNNINVEWRGNEDLITLGLNRQRIGNRIKELRQAKGLSTYQLAEMTGFKQPNIVRIEQGRYAVRLDTLTIICEALGCTVEIVEN